MSLWLMVNLVIPSMPLSLVSGTTPDTLLRRFLPWGEHIVTGRRESSQCCSSCCPFLGVVGRCRRACWSLHPSSPWLEAEACVSPASRRWTTVWSRPPWHCTKTSGQKGGFGEGSKKEKRGKGRGVNALALNCSDSRECLQSKEHKKHQNITFMLCCCWCVYVCACVRGCQQCQIAPLHVACTQFSIAVFSSMVHKHACNYSLSMTQISDFQQ